MSDPVPVLDRDAAEPPPAGPPAPAERRPGRWEVLLTPLAAHQAAVVRIGVALAWGGFLLREWPHRRVLYGDLSPWSSDLSRQLLADTHAFTVLGRSSDRWWFELVYHLAILASAALLLGWRTRASSVLFAVTAVSLQNRNILVGDGGDNVVHLMAIYLALTRCGLVWSLDARRRARRSPAGPAAGEQPGEVRAVLDALASMLHNCAMLVIAVQVVLIYSTAGWYKIQGSRWQDGTAVYYPLHLGYFSPWPALSGLLGAGLLTTVALSYGTVVAQVAFPFTLANRRLKNVLLALMMAEHAAIAVTLGLPFFSLAMIAADAVFLPTGALRRLERWAVGLLGLLGLAGPAGPAGPAGLVERPAEGSRPESG
ncbi:hypothetical protein GCM10010441_54670 [Kitasatospora paracochleata]|uniref:HTTM-like domain-containing protein n=1 Tax=Kitasatospora paracochleata TaxID=58354 RepID=A0ABT1J7Y1_9ACTN|nr:hypothetical protein [Kitasatospora paracochleata]